MTAAAGTAAGTTRIGLGYDFVAEAARARAALLGYAQRLTGDAAARDDLVQDTLLRAWAARDRFAAGTSFRAWLFRIARNRFLSGLRHRRRLVEMSDEEVARRLWEPAVQEAGLHLRDAARAVQALPPAQAQALLAVNGADGDLDGIAGRLGIPSGTLRSRAHRARRAVVRHLDQPPPRHPQPGPAAEPARADDRPSGGARAPRGAYAAWKASGSRMIG